MPEFIDVNGQEYKMSFEDGWLVIESGEHHNDTWICYNRETFDKHAILQIKAFIDSVLR